MEKILQRNDTTDDVETERSKELQAFYTEYVKAYETAYEMTFGVTYETTDLIAVK